MNKYDKRRKYFLVLDCETATLPIASTFADEGQKKRIAIAKPLIYDLGWKVIDGMGREYARKNYLITEIFSVPEIFNTAYYKEKRPLYIEKLNRGEIILSSWKEAVAELVADMDACVAVGAYNSMFDFKKGIPFTELYINQLYSKDFHKWLKWQNDICVGIANNAYRQNEKEFDPDNFLFRGKAYPLFDIWGLACKHILNCDDYKRMCISNGWATSSGQYFKTSAETAFRFFSGVENFEEAHTAIDDTDIESQLFAEVCRRTKKKFEMGIIYFPFRILGRIENWGGC